MFLSVGFQTYLLKTTVRQIDKIFSLCRVTVPVLCLSEVVVGVVILHSILEGVLGRLIRVRWSWTSVAGLVRTSRNTEDKERTNKGNLKKTKNSMFVEVSTAFIKRKKNF